MNEHHFIVTTMLLHCCSEMYATSLTLTHLFIMIRLLVNNIRGAFDGIFHMFSPAA